MIDFNELATRIENDGELTIEEANIIIGNAGRHVSERIPLNACKGSLSDVEALHCLKLPGWNVRGVLIDADGSSQITVSNDDGLEKFSGRAKRSSKAWFAAILRALA